MFNWLKRIFTKNPDQVELDFHRASSALALQAVNSVQRQIVYLSQLLDDEREKSLNNLGNYQFVIASLVLAAGGEVIVGKEMVELANAEHIHLDTQLLEDGSLSVKIVEHKEEVEKDE